MRALLVVLVVLLVAGGLYTLVAAGVGGLVGAGRSKADGAEDAGGRTTNLNRTQGDG